MIQSDKSENWRGNMNITKSKKTYSKDFKEKMIKRMLPPENIQPKDLAKESGVSRTALYNWLCDAKSSINNNSCKTELEWIPVNIQSTDSKDIVSEMSESIKVNIGKMAIEVEVGFNKDLLLELLRVVDKI
jgi:transposase-like protein